MKKAGFAILALAVCVMMVAPMAMAGSNPKGGPAKKYSTMTDDFNCGPTQGSWNGGTPSWDASGGLVTIYNVPDGLPYAIGNTLIWNTHSEFFLMFSAIPTNNGAPSWLSPKNWMWERHINAQGM